MVTLHPLSRTHVKVLHPEQTWAAWPGFWSRTDIMAGDFCAMCPLQAELRHAGHGTERCNFRAEGRNSFRGEEFPPAHQNRAARGEFKITARTCYPLGTSLWPQSVSPEGIAGSPSLSLPRIPEEWGILLSFVCWFVPPVLFQAGILNKKQNVQLPASQKKNLNIVKLPNLGCPYCVDFAYTVYFPFPFSLKKSSPNNFFLPIKIAFFFTPKRWKIHTQWLNLCYYVLGYSLSDARTLSSGNPEFWKCSEQHGDTAVPVSVMSSLHPALS